MYFWIRVFILFVDVARSGIAGSYGSSAFSVLRDLHTVFHNGYTELHDQQQGPGAPISLRPYQRLLFLMLLSLTTAILTGVRRCFTVTVICVSDGQRRWASFPIGHYDCDLRVSDSQRCWASFPVGHYDRDLRVWRSAALSIFSRWPLWLWSACLTVSGVEHLFPLAICMASLEQCLFRSSAHFLIVLFVFEKQYLFIWLHWVLTVHVGSSSLTSSQTWVPCIGSTESKQLDQQGSPWCLFWFVF